MNAETADRALASAISNATSPDSRRWWVLALIGLAQSMLIIDVTVVNVALPSIGADLHSIEPS
jgi:hypothetical protein